MKLHSSHVHTSLHMIFLRAVPYVNGFMGEIYAVKQVQNFKNS